MNNSDSLRQALLDRLAAQWIAVGVPLVGRPDAALIDLEALVVMTAGFAGEEARIFEGGLDWCAGYGSAVNATRLTVVAEEIDLEPSRLEVFAALVAGAGGPRWPVAHDVRLAHEPPGRVHVRDLRPPALIAWRLRSAFGVAARADVLTVLATTPDRAMSLADLARLARSSKRNVTLAVRALALADVVDVEHVGNEQRVRLTRQPGFREWLGHTPPFVDWTSRFAVVTRVLGFEVASTLPSIVAAIEARAFVEKLNPLIRRNELPSPDTSVLGEAFGDEFLRWRGALAAAISP